ncbi:TPA: prophage tail fiber N-terminal domain-containing protein [Escherichia coli]|nr:prophage tail fiber N-terminal domain-containing protein [Escherichia coli]HEI3782744.1 prophage tail fiber N-terminal domain-containing protein [Escherichia coli]
MSVLISGVLIDGAGIPMSGCHIILKSRVNTSEVVMRTVADVVTGNNGEYAIDVQTGKYDVYLRSCIEREFCVGNIAVYDDSKTGTLNDFLTALDEGDFKPDVVKRFEEMVKTVVQLSDQVAADKVVTTAAAEAARQSEQSSAISAEKSKASEEAAKRSEAEAASYRDEARQFAEQSQKNADATKQDRDEIVTVLGDTLKTSRCLGEIADAGEEAQSEALHNLGAGSAARHDVQSGVYDRNAGVARPGAFGFGAEIASSEVISWNWAKEPDGFAIHFSQAMPGRYRVSETNATGSSDGTIPGVVFAGFVEIIWMTSRMQGQTVDKVSKTAVFYGINGGIYASRLAGGKFDKWIKLDKTPLELVSPLFSVLTSQTNFSRTPDIGGLILAAYKKEGATAPFSLNRYDYAKGSELTRVALILPEGEKGLVCELEPENAYNPLPGTYRTLSGHVDVSTNDRFVSLFVRIS